jgi:hypothetical protein
MTRAIIFGSLLTLTGVAYGSGATGVGMSQPQRQALSVRSGSYFGGTSGSGRRSRGGFFYSGSGGRRSGGGFSFGK